MEKNKISIATRRGNTTTFKETGLEQVIDMIRNGEYADKIHSLRELYPLLTLKRDEAGEIDGDNVELLRPIPKVYFGSVQTKKGGKVTAKTVNDLLLLQINNLSSYDEAISFRNGASQMPQTLLAFLGASGRSVKIVCRGAFDCFPLARRVYSDQLQVNVDNIPMTKTTSCYISHDPEIFFNPGAIAFQTASPPSPLPLRSAMGGGVDTFVDQNAVRPLSTINHQLSTDFLLPGRNLTETRIHVFEAILEKAVGNPMEVLLQGIDENGPEKKDPVKVYEVLNKVAEGCLEAGIPQELAEQLMKANSNWGHDKELVATVFERVYATKKAKAFIEKRRSYRPERYLSQTSLLTLRTEYFLETHYEMRRNVMTGTVQWRYNDGRGYAFRDLTTEYRNMMTLRALEQGLKSWDRDIDRYIHSPFIPQYDPVNDYLAGLPRWDGKDRVAALFNRIPIASSDAVLTSTNHSTPPPIAQRRGGGQGGGALAFHRWLLSMVAHWQGRDRYSGNALVPLLIGPQGTGKSSFCRILLPPQLQHYYNDRINFRNDHDLNIGLTSFALINLDEFDKITIHQQPLLKYLISTRDMKFRAPYGRVIEEHRKYASFIGTTNQLQPLTDDSGSRRFLCIPVAGMIDFTTPVDHAQLYAQLVEELRQGERYYLTDEENQQLMEHNAAFVRASGLEDMILSIYSKPLKEDDGEWVSLADIAQTLKKHYRNLAIDDRMLIRIGRLMCSRALGFQRKHTMDGSAYLVQRRAEG